MPWIAGLLAKVLPKGWICFCVCCGRHDDSVASTNRLGAKQCRLFHVAAVSCKPLLANKKEARAKEKPQQCRRARKDVSSDEDVVQQLQAHETDAQTHLG